jgi:hypothetical protein
VLQHCGATGRAWTRRRGAVLAGVCVVYPKLCHITRSQSAIVRSGEVSPGAFTSCGPCVGAAEVHVAYLIPHSVRPIVPCTHV